VPYNYTEHTGPKQVVDKRSFEDERQVSGKPSPDPEPKERWQITQEWVPPKLERVRVPGYWAYGIKKTWTGTHWKYETDRDNKTWIDETYEWQEKQEGYYLERKVMVK
jgi:hypothetical protein